MRTIGQIIKTARTEKKLSVSSLAEITKIKASFIVSIENENWSSLPSFAVILGFVKSISTALGLDQNSTVAVLKRDYPPKSLNINPKPDVESKFKWSPKITFIVGISTVVLFVLGYLGIQYMRFISPARITIESPKEGQIVLGGSVMVFGSSDPDAKITINGQPVLADEDGKFSYKIEVVPTTSEIVIKAISRSGKERTISRKITVQ